MSTRKKVYFFYRGALYMDRMKTPSNVFQMIMTADRIARLPEDLVWMIVTEVVKWSWVPLRGGYVRRFMPRRAR